MTRHMDCEQSLTEKLGLPEHADKKAIEKALGEASRMIRAIALGLSPTASWAEISTAYKDTPLPPINTQVLGDGKGHWMHPVSGVVIRGKLITKDLEVLGEQDMFASPDGSWQTCPVPKLLFRPWSHTLWVRTVHKERVWNTTTQSVQKTPYLTRLVP